MFKLLLKFKRRIKKLLKVQSSTRQRHVPGVRSRTVKALMLVTGAVLVAFLYPGEELFDPLDVPRAGEISRETIRAPFTITVKKTDRELEEERELVRVSIPYILEVDTTVTENIYRRLGRFVGQADSLRRSVKEVDELRRQGMIEHLSSQFPMLSRNAIARSLDSAIVLDSVRSRLERIFRNDIYPVGVVTDLAAVPEGRNKMVLVRRGERESIFQRSRVLDLALAGARLLTALNRTGERAPIDVEFYYLLGRNFLTPNLRVDMNDYQNRVSRELSLITEVKDVVNKGDTIAIANERVDQNQARVLEEMARLHRMQATEEGWLQSIQPLLARLVLVFAAFSSLYLFLFYFRREIFYSNPKLLALFLVFALQFMLIYLVDQVAVLADIQSLYVFPIVFLPIMVTILFDAEVGILSTIVFAVIVGVMHRFSLTITLMTTLVGFVACFASMRVRRRSHFYRIMVAVLFTNAALIFVIEALKLTPSQELLTELVNGTVIGLLSILLTIFLLPVIESLFGITTDITLLELSDLNHPLLKRLAIEAPGTYHHAIIVGNLCEAAAKGIGANSLLARVGAYFHDIGKIEIPEYFVENQLGVKSKHESLTPSMSALILSSHVKKGRLLGEEADLPDDVLNFIEEHHGTMVMTYFYNKALEQGADESSIDKFRYPGPKPQVRETGITMLADAVEAASRTLEDPKPARIDSLIQRIITDRFQSGELDECPLTLRDLAGIREAFAQVLIAAFHQRIVYPTKQEG